MPKNGAFTSPKIGSVAISLCKSSSLSVQRRSSSNYLSRFRWDQDACDNEDPKDNPTERKDPNLFTLDISPDMAAVTNLYDKSLVGLNLQSENSILSTTSAVLQRMPGKPVT